MNAAATHPSVSASSDSAVWRMDPKRSSVEFHASALRGLVKVRGHFEIYEGALDLSTNSVELTIQADSLDTHNTHRDRALRSGGFFDVVNHPTVRFVSHSATINDQRLKASGWLYAAGNRVPLDLDAALVPTDDELELEVIAHADSRALGMSSWGGRLNPESTLVVRGRLVHGDPPDTSNPTESEHLT